MFFHEVDFGAGDAGFAPGEDEGEEAVFFVGEDAAAGWGVEGGEVPGVGDFGVVELF